MQNMDMGLQKAEPSGSRRKSLYLSLVILIIFVTATITISLPDNEIRVTSFQPLGRTELRSNITIKFSKKMVPIDSLDKPVLNPPVRFTPPIAGMARWVETDMLRFFPDAELLPATEYSARVQSDQVWLSGLKIVNADAYRFRTPDLRLDRQRSSVEELYDDAGRVRIVGFLTLNYPVSLKELQDRLTITGTNKEAKQTLKCTVDLLDEYDEVSEVVDAGSSTQPTDRFGSSFRIMSEPFERLEAAQYYSVTIKKGLLCRNCQLELSDPLTFSISVEAKRPLTVLAVRTNNEGEQVGLRIEFSHSVDPELAKTFVTLDPPLDFTVEGNYSMLNLRGDFHPGEVYTVSVSKGLRGTNALPLQFDFSTKVQLEDLQPSISFSSRGLFLPRAGNGLLEFRSVNIDKAVVEIEQIFSNNLVYFLMSGYNSPYAAENEYWDRRAAQLGRSLFIKDVTLESQRNAYLPTTIDINSIVGGKGAGLFKVSARAKDQRWVGDSRYVMLTDLGLSARLGDDFLMVWVNSLTDASPVAGATIKLISRNNQILLEGRSDSRGIATFRDIKPKLTGFEPYVIVAEKAEDLSYLNLNESQLPIADFDVSGRPYLTSGYEAFVYSDRGIYRPGDTVRIVSVVRGTNASVPAAFPYSLNVIDTRGKVFTNFRMTSGTTGLSTIDFVIPEYAATGKYTLTAQIGDEITIGRSELLVEEFMPDRIKVSASTDATSYLVGAKINIDVDGKMLFGPPAAGYQTSASIQIEATPFVAQNFKDYSFVNSDRAFNRLNIDLPDAILDDTGGYRYSYQLPERLTAPSSLKGLIGVTVSEPGGRGVSAYSEVLIHPYSNYVGIKMGHEGYAEPGKNSEVNLVVVDRNGSTIATDSCSFKFYSITYNTVYKKDRAGLYRWVSEQKAKLISSALEVIPQSGKTVQVTPSSWGMYRVVAELPSGGHSAAVDFWASGWGYAPWAMDNPDKLELGLDKREYQPGETALLQVRAPFAGKLFITLERDQILDVITSDLPENTGEIRIPVKKGYLPNVYITAAVVRPASVLEPNKPARAFGLIPLRLSNDSKRLALSIEAPAVIKPRTKTTVTVKLPKGKPADITLAAVDAGILQLTEFKTPDPLDYFWGKKQPALKPYDLYAYLYPQVKKSSSHLSAGDRMFAASRKRHLNPFMAKRVRSVALWSGLVKPDKEGVANITLDIPEFNGKLVLMAVSALGDQFGSATQEMLVRDRIVVMESFPRFVSPNDVFEGFITLYNNTGAAADVTAVLSSSGPVQSESPASVTVHIENGKEGRANFRLKAGQTPGKLAFKVMATAGNDSSFVTIDLPNRPAVPLTTQYGSGVVGKDTPAKFILPADWIPGTEQYVVQTSAISAMPFARNMQYLLSYPYGCVEQTTSRLFPLLYFDDLARIVRPELFGGKGAEYFVQEGIVRLSSMILPDRSFSFWPGSGTGYPWATIYASHFLSEASRAGYAVDRKLLNDIYDNLADIASGKQLIAVGNPDAHRIYAAYVLASAGRLDQKTVGLLKRLEPSTLSTEAKYQLAATLALTGNVPDAAKLLPADIQPNLFDPETGGYFQSGVRTDAVGLDAMMIVAPGSPAVEVLAKSLADRASAGRWYTTQDNAFALLALGKYFRSKKSLGFSGTITVASESPIRIDSTGFKLVRNDLGQKPVKIEVTGGDGSCYFFWQASGLPLANATPEFDRGLRVRREYLDEDAHPIDLSSVKLGDRVICVITAEALDKSVDNVVINDLLPAGFEIENPRLKTSARLAWLPSDGSRIDYQDMRDDRLLLFTSLMPKRQSKFYYSLRATCAGEFKVPPISAECMYNPLVASSASSGAVTVVR